MHLLNGKHQALQKAQPQRFIKHLNQDGKGFYLEEP